MPGRTGCSDRAPGARGAAAARAAGRSTLTHAAEPAVGACGTARSLRPAGAGTGKAGRPSDLARERGVVDRPADELAVRAALLDDHLAAVAAARGAAAAGAGAVQTADRRVLDLVLLQRAALSQKRRREHHGHEGRGHAGY